MSTASAVPNPRGPSLIHGAAVVCFACAASLLTPAAVADAFAVQIGAFRHADSRYLEPATNYGELQALTREDGIIAYSVGPFESAEDAQTALKLLRAHYPDAFVRAADAKARTLTPGTMVLPDDAALATPVQPPSTSPPVVEQTLWASLTRTEKANVVYLDGVLHIKQGEQLIPLEEYRRSP